MSNRPQRPMITAEQWKQEQWKQWRDKIKNVQLSATDIENMRLANRNANDPSWPVANDN